MLCGRVIEPSNDVISVPQESAKMFEQNAALFGSTVESLLYRYGKVKSHTGQFYKLREAILEIA